MNILFIKNEQKTWIINQKSITKNRNAVSGIYGINNLEIDPYEPRRVCIDAYDPLYVFKI